MGKKDKNIIEYRTYTMPFHFPALLLDGEEWRISDIRSNRLHFHNCLEIGICHDHSGVLAFENETLFFRAGDVSYIPRHMLHTTCSTRGAKSRWSYLFVDMERILSGRLPTPPPPLPQTHFLLGRDAHPRVHFLVMALIEEINAQRKDYHDIVKSLLHVLYYEFLRMAELHPQAKQAEPENSFALRPALDYMDDHYDQPVSMKLLADMCHLSETHFRRRFVSIMGTSPLQFLNTVRITQACVLLITTEESILSIAETVGFATISSFNRSFLQTMGMSPRTYRKRPSLREEIIPRRTHVLAVDGWMTPEIVPEFAYEDTE